MRTMFLSAALAACLVSPALAQTGATPAYPPSGSPPPGYATPAYPSPPGAPSATSAYPQAPSAYPQATSAYPQAPSAYPPARSAYPPAQPMPMNNQAAPPASAGAEGNTQYQPPSAMPLSHRASNIDRQDAQSQVAPNLPSPQLGPNAGPVAYLQAAQAALAAGRTGETQEALEQAQTRLLDRSVPLGEVGAPDRNPAVTDISQALHALAAGDRAGSMQMIQTAMRAAESSR